MKGEEDRDNNDRLDRDNYNTNFASGLESIGKGITQSAKDLNTTQSNKDGISILGDMSINGITYRRDANGNLMQVKRDNIVAPKAKRKVKTGK